MSDASSRLISIMHHDRDEIIDEQQQAANNKQNVQPGENLETSLELSTYGISSIENMSRCQRRYYPS